MIVYVNFGKLRQSYGLCKAQMEVQVGLYMEVQEKKLLLKQMQPPSFKGEGTNVEKDAEAWIESIDDYFTTVGTAESNRAML